LDGRPVAVTAGWDNTVRLWDLSTSRQIGDPLTGHTDWVTSVSAVQTKEGPVAVSRSRDGTLRLWDLTTGQQTASTTLDTATGCQTVSATVRDGRPLAVTAEADRIRMWNPASGRRIETVYVLPQPACALTTAPGGQLLVAFGTDIASLRRTER
jgi:WD40 repeat protein